MAIKTKQLILHGTIREAADYNTELLMRGLLGKRRTQVIEVEIVEGCWEVVFCKDSRIEIKFGTKILL